MDAHTLSLSAIDLTFCDPILAPELSWSVLDDDHGSDHFPVCVSISARGHSSRPRRWCTRRADWEAFTRECLTHLTPEVDGYEPFIETLTQICDTTIPKTSGRPRKHTPWFSDECRVALREKRKAYRKAMKFPTAANFTLFRRARAKCRRTLAKANGDLSETLSRS